MLAAVHEERGPNRDTAVDTFANFYPEMRITTRASFPATNTSVCEGSDGGGYSAATLSAPAAAPKGTERKWLLHLPFVPKQ